MALRSIYVCIDLSIYLYLLQAHTRVHRHVCNANVSVSSPLVAKNLENRRTQISHRSLLPDTLSPTPFLIARRLRPLPSSGLSMFLSTTLSPLLFPPSLVPFQMSLYLFIYLSNYLSIYLSVFKLSLILFLSSPHSRHSFPPPAPIVYLKVYLFANPTT
jgi:hypothetical protein